MSRKRPAITAPESLRPDHDLSDFDCGVRELNVWLQRRALGNEVSGVSRVFVVTHDGKVIAYYALAAGSVVHAVATNRVRRNALDPVPVMMLGRLAVDHRWQGCGIARSMLREAVARVLYIAEHAGVRALLVHAISPEAKRFYEAHGFSPSKADPMTLMITLADAQRAVSLPSGETFN